MDKGEIVSRLRMRGKWKFLLDESDRELMEEAANTIQDLATELAQMKWDNKWVLCEERMPETPESNPEFDGKPLEMYLVITAGSRYCFRAFWNGKFFTDGIYRVENVTHWRALPDLPESYLYNKEMRHD